MTDGPQEDDPNMLQIRQGKMILSHGGLTDLGCLLAELTPKFCRGKAMLQYLEPKVAASWLSVLQPSRKIHIHLDVPAPIGRLEADGIIIEVRDEKRQIEIAVQFTQVRAENAPAETTPAPPPRSTGILYRNQKLGAVLIQMGHLTSAEAENAVKQAHGRGERLGHYLTHSKRLSSDIVCRALALQSGVPMTDLTIAEIDESSDNVFPYDIMKRHTFVTFDSSPMVACIAVADPLAPEVLAELTRISKRKIEMFLALEDLIVKHLDEIKTKQRREPRKHLRYEFAIPVRYQFCGRMGTPAEKQKHDGITRNISEDGFLIEGAPATFGSSDEIRRRGMCVDVYVAGPKQEVRGICQLRTIKERDNSSGKCWIMGLKIVEMSTEDRRRLKELCISAVKARMKPA